VDYERRYESAYSNTNRKEYEAEKKMKIIILMQCNNVDGGLERLGVARVVKLSHSNEANDINH